MDALAHHGIKGQKWYNRRYQNQDGSLTPEGRKRYGSGKQFVKRGTSKNGTSTKVSKTSNQKSYKDMTDAELRNAINRLQLEKQYRDLTPAQISVGKRFMNSVMKDVVAPAAKNVGKAYLEKQLRTSLGLSTSDNKEDKKKK